VGPPTFLEEWEGEGSQGHIAHTRVMAVAALVRFWQFYESALETRPLLTNMANTAVLFAVGDTIGQGFSHKRGQPWDFPRALALIPPLLAPFPLISLCTRCAGLARAVIYGGLIYCVPAHVHYNFIDKAMTYLATTKQLFRPSFIPLAKTCTELFVYWFYFTSVLYHLSMGLMEGIGLPATLERVKRNFWKTCTSGWVYW
jgi:hypothetical protein